MVKEKFMNVWKSERTNSAIILEETTLVKIIGEFGSEGTSE